MLKKKRALPLVYGFILAAAAIAILPLLFTVTNSFMTEAEQNSRYSSVIDKSNQTDFQSHNIHFVRPGLIPEQPTGSQYIQLLFNRPGYLRMFWNSVLLVVPVLIGQFLIAPMAAYGFENIKWRHKEKLYFLYLIVMLMPTQLLLVPNFIVAGWLQIRDSYLAIILPALFHPFGVFLIRQQLKGFPRECTEAAALDGAGPWQTYRQVVRPNLSSVVAAMAVLLFVDNWNIVDQAVVFIEDTYRQPLSVYLGNAAENLPGIFFAASVMYMIPAVLVFLLGQDGLAKGIGLSNLK